MDKDTMIKFRSTLAGKNSKGGDRLQLYLTMEEAAALVSEIQSAAKASSDRGVKLDIHTSDKEYEGRKFKSTIAFVKNVQEAGTLRPQAAPKKFVPKTVS